MVDFVNMVIFVILFCYFILYFISMNVRLFKIFRLKYKMMIDLKYCVLLICNFLL